MPGRPPVFWETISTFVSSKVRLGLTRSPNTRGPLIAYLRDLEDAAWQNSTCRNAVQTIASGRRLLGDEIEIGRRMRRPFQTLLDRVA